MRKREFNKLIQEQGCKKVLSLFMQGDVFLTDKQLDKAIALNDGRGGAYLKYDKKSIENKLKK